MSRRLQGDYASAWGSLGEGLQLSRVNSLLGDPLEVARAGQQDRAPAAGKGEVGLLQVQTLYSPVCCSLCLSAAGFAQQPVQLPVFPSPVMTIFFCQSLTGLIFVDDWGRVVVT